MKIIFPQYLAMCEVADATTIVVTYWEAQSNFSETQPRCEVRGVKLSVCLCAGICQIEFSTQEDEGEISTAMYGSLAAGSL